MLSLMTEDVVFLVPGQPPFGWTRLRVAMTPPGGGQSVKRAGHTLSVLRKSGGRWRLARDANMLTPTN